MTPEDRTLDGAAVDEVARTGAAATTPAEAAPAESAPAGDAAGPDENVYHKALDAYMNGDLSGVVKLVDGVLEQKPVAGLKSRLERLRRRATDRLSKEAVDAPADPAAVVEPAAAVAPAQPAAVAPAQPAVVAAVEPAPAAPVAEPVAAVEPVVVAPEPDAVASTAAPSVETPADAITAEPPVEAKPEIKADAVVAAPTPDVVAPESAPPAEPIVVVTKADTPTAPERAAKRPGPAPARPSSSGNTTMISGGPSVNRPPSGGPAAAPGARPKPGAPAAPTGAPASGTPAPGVRSRVLGSGSQPALSAPAASSPTSALKAELDRVAGELDKLRKVVSGVEEHIVKVAEAYGKLAKDGKRKDQAYDQLYEELRQYKDNFLKSAQKPLFLDVVLLFDGISRTIAQFDDMPDEKVTRQMVVDALSHTRDEILELLYRRDIEKISDTPKKLDVSIQKPVTRIDTDNADEDRDIVQVVREGFRWSGVVLRPQEVVVKRSIKEREPQ